jgi:hypothetical protein
LGRSKGRTPTPVQIITILPSAREDLGSGAEFYESQLEGLGRYFLETLFAEIDNLKNYAVYYSIDADSAIVKAILDCRRDPASIRDRLE